MLKSVSIAAVMVIVTTAIHAACMTFIVRSLRAQRHLDPARARPRRLRAVVATVLLMLAASLVEASAWAVVYLLIGAVSGAEPALYFSIVTFTTLGYGDLVIDSPWRLLASFEAANGIIMFGWTTALVMAVVQRAYVDVIGGDQGA